MLIAPKNARAVAFFANTLISRDFCLLKFCSELVKTDQFL